MSGDDLRDLLRRREAILVAKERAAVQAALDEPDVSLTEKLLANPLYADHPRRLAPPALSVSDGINGFMTGVGGPAAFDCFVIMPIGRPETDRVWVEAYEPTIKSCSLNPVRIDKEDDGGLLTPQIIQFLQVAPLLIADLTFARPNCYYEVGFAMGLNREQSMILCCREGHNADSPGFVASANKVHFDLQDYGILWWDSGDLGRFAQELRLKIERRKKTLRAETVATRATPLPATRVSQDIATELDYRLKQLAEREERLLAALWKKRT
jgi:hypothetical protein